jgi:myo-inositol-1(or 4)-monophosphatase
VRHSGVGATRRDDPAAEAGPPSAEEVDLEHARSFATATARAAGDIVRDAVRRGFTISAKGPDGDIVTSIDVAAERHIIGRIRAEFPGHRIHSEEAGIVAGDGDGAWLWLTDPLDGTNNVAIGLSMYVVGMTLCRDGVPMLGVIHDPVSGRTWSAVKGGGIAGVVGLDGVGAAAGAAGAGAVGRCRRPSGGGWVLAWTQGYDVGSTDPTSAALKLLLESTARRVLQLWTPLLSWAMLARGDIDGFVGYRAGLLDLSGGALIAAESGLVITDFAGAPFDHRVSGAEATRDFVAGRPEVVSRVLDLVGRVSRTAAVLRQVWDGPGAAAR